MGYFKKIKLQPKLDGKYELIEPVMYFVGYKGSRDVIYVPKGFETDGASIPSIFRYLLGNPFDTKFIARAIVHDYLYETCRRTREEADSIFYEILRNAGVNKLKAKLMFLRVRLFGNSFYYKQLD